MNLNLVAPSRNFNKTLQLDLLFGDRVTNIQGPDLSCAAALGIHPLWGQGD